MNLYLSLIIELVFLALSILILFNIRKKIGLIPLYVLLGALQYLQVLSGNISVQLFEKYTMFPSSSIVFSALLFALLLIYIKAGVVKTRALIIGIVITNFVLAILFGTSYFQELELGILNPTNVHSISDINFEHFLYGTVLLLFDSLLLIILYQFLMSKIKKIHYLLVIFISLAITLIFDSLAFTLGLNYNNTDFLNILLSQLIVKTISAVVFSIILYCYLIYIDKEKSQVSFITTQERDIFSIIKYKRHIKNLQNEKKLVEEKLSSKIGTTLNNISDGFVSLDANGCYTYVNNKAGEFLGKTPESLIGKHIWTEFPKEIGQPFYEVYHRAINTQQTQYVETYYEPLSKWFENRFYPSKLGVAIYFIDKTDQKSTEIILDRNNRNIENILNTIGDAIFVKNDKSEIILVNNAFCDIFNLSRDAILGKTLFDKVTPKEQEVFLKVDREVLANGIENVNEETLTIKGGYTRFISTKKTRFIDNDGKKYLIGITRDITDRVIAEKRLKESEKYLDNIINNIGDPIFVKDEQGQFLLANKSFYDFFGSSKEEVIGETFAKEIPLHLRNYYLKDDEKVLTTGVEVVNERRVTRKNGDVKYIYTKKTRFIDENGKKYLIGIIRDVTALKSVEIELEKHKNNLEQVVKIRTEELDTQNKELQRINKLFVGRELKMIELKNIIKELQAKK